MSVLAQRKGAIAAARHHGSTGSPTFNYVNRTVVQDARNGTTAHTINFPAATSGNLLLMVLAGGVTLTTPTGWTLVNSSISGQGMYIWKKTASAGESSATTTANGSNYPIGGCVYEFSAGSTVDSSVTSGATAQAYNAANPSETPSTAQMGLAFTDYAVYDGTTSWTNLTWTGATEDFDLYAVQTTTEGYLISGAWVVGAGTAFTPTTTPDSGTVAARQSMSLAMTNTTPVTQHTTADVTVYYGSVIRQLNSHWNGLTFAQYNTDPLTNSVYWDTFAKLNVDEIRVMLRWDGTKAVTGAGGGNLTYDGDVWVQAAIDHGMTPHVGIQATVSGTGSSDPVYTASDCSNVANYIKTHVTSTPVRWMIGNEPGNWLSANGHGEDYTGTLFISCRDAIRAQVPTAVVTGYVESYWDSWSAGVFLDTVGSDIQCLDWHHYGNPGEDLLTWLSNTTAAETNANQAISVRDSRGLTGMELQIGELNGSWDRNTARQLYTETGTWMASVLGHMLPLDSGVTIHYYADLNGNDSGLPGLSVFANDGNLSAGLSPSGMGWAMWSGWTTAQGTLPRISNGVVATPTHSLGSNIETWATRATSGQYDLIVVNKNTSGTALDITVALVNGPADGSAAIWQYTGTQGAAPAGIAHTTGSVVSGNIGLHLPPLSVTRVVAS